MDPTTKQGPLGQPPNFFDATNTLPWVRKGDNDFLSSFGKFVCVASFLFVFLCAWVGLLLIYNADQSYQHDTTPLLAPPTPTKGGTK